MIATGGTAEAAAKLIKISKGNVAGFIFVINLFDLGGCDKLLKQDYKIENLIEFPGHWNKDLTLYQDFLPKKLFHIPLKRA